MRGVLGGESMMDIREYLRGEIERVRDKSKDATYNGYASLWHYTQGKMDGLKNILRELEKDQSTDDGYKYYKVIAVALTEVMVEAENAEDARAKAEDELTNRDAHWTAVDCIKIKKRTFERGFDI